MPSANHSETPASELRTTNQSDVAKTKAKQQKHKVRGVSGDSKLKLAKPWSHKARRIVRKKTENLIEKRNEIDRQLLREVQRKNVAPKDWLPRDQLLQRHTQLEKREERHVRRRTRVLAKLERLYRLDPTADRAYDYDMVRYLLWKFKRHLGPLMDHHGKKGDAEGEVNDDSSSSDDEWEDISDQDEGGRGKKRKSSAGKKRKREESANSNTSKKRLKTGSTSKQNALPSSGKGKKNKQSGASLKQAVDI